MKEKKLDNVAYEPGTHGSVAARGLRGPRAARYLYNYLLLIERAISNSVSTLVVLSPDVPPKM